MSQTVPATPTTATANTAKPAKRERQPLDVVAILALGLPLLVGVAFLVAAAAFLILH